MQGLVRLAVTMRFYVYKSSSINLSEIQTGYFELFENPEEQKSCGREARSEFY